MFFDCLFLFFNNQKYLLIRNSQLDTKHIRLKYNSITKCDLCSQRLILQVPSVGSTNAIAFV